MIFTYFKNANFISQSSGGEDSVLKFKKELSSMGHLYTSYENTEGLLLHFSNQLDKMKLKKLSK